MGKVFTFKQITEGQIPNVSDFNVLAERIRENFGKRDHVLGAVLCGSYISGKYSQRSDFDCLLVYQPDSNHSIISVLQAISHDANLLYIDLELIPIARDAAERGLHTVGHSFFGHLRGAGQKGGIIKTDPTILLKMVAGDPKREVMQYLVNKIQRLDKGLARMNVMSETELCRFLQKALEAPLHAARKMVWLNDNFLQDDLRGEIINKYLTITPIGGTRQLFLNLLQADDWYSAELKAGSLKYRTRYDEVMYALKEFATLTVEFLKRNAFLIK